MIPDINLLPKREKKTDLLKIALIAAGSVVLIAAIIASITFKIVKNEIEVATREQQRLQEQQKQYEAIYDEIVIASGKNTLQNSVTFIESVSYPVSPIIDTTEKHLVPHSYLRNYAFTKTQVAITVDFESIADASEYVATLVKDAHFIDVQLTSVANFEPVNVGSIYETIFEEIPRYTATITMDINQPYLAGGGEK